MVMLQAERAQHDQLAISIKGLEDRYKSKTELCKKLEERATTKAAAAWGAAVRHLPGGQLEHGQHLQEWVVTALTWPCTFDAIMAKLERD